MSGSSGIPCRNGNQLCADQVHFKILGGNERRSVLRLVLLRPHALEERSQRGLSIGIEARECHLRWAKVSAKKLDNFGGSKRKREIQASSRACDLPCSTAEALADHILISP